MDDVFRLSEAVRRDPAVAAWFSTGEPLRLLVQPWYEVLRDLAPDVGELVHDHRPTLCVGDVAFAYVDAFRTHAAVGFFRGATLDDPSGLLDGSGKRMRHVKLLWGEPIDEATLRRLIEQAYLDARACLAGGD